MQTVAILEKSNRGLLAYAKEKNLFFYPFYPETGCKAQLLRSGKDYIILDSSDILHNESSEHLASSSQSELVLENMEGNEFILPDCYSNKDNNSNIVSNIEHSDASKFSLWSASIDEAIKKWNKFVYYDVSEKKSKTSLPSSSVLDQMIFGLDNSDRNNSVALYVFYAFFFILIGIQSGVLWSLLTLPMFFLYLVFSWESRMTKISSLTESQRNLWLMENNYGEEKNKYRENDKKQKDIYPYFDSFFTKEAFEHLDDYKIQHISMYEKYSIFHKIHLVLFEVPVFNSFLHNISVLFGIGNKEKIDTSAISCIEGNKIELSEEIKQIDSQNNTSKDISSIKETSLFPSPVLDNKQENLSMEIPQNSYTYQYFTILEKLEHLGKTEFSVMQTDPLDNEINQKVQTILSFANGIKEILKKSWYEEESNMVRFTSLFHEKLLGILEEYIQIRSNILYLDHQDDDERKKSAQTKTKLSSFLDRYIRVYKNKKESLLSNMYQNFENEIDELEFHLNASLYPEESLYQVNQGMDGANDGNAMQIASQNISPFERSPMVRLN